MVEIMSEDEHQARIDLAAAYQLAALFGWTDWIFQHFTVKIPNTEHFLINGYGLMFDEVTASNLVKIDLDGNVVNDPLGLGVNRSGFVLHSIVHRAREDAVCVLHTHTRAGIAVACQKNGLLAMSQHALRVRPRLAYHDYEGILLGFEERTRLVAAMGTDKKALMLRQHGMLSLGTTVRDAFEIMYYLQRACEIQIDALSAGLNGVLDTPDEISEHVYAQFTRPGREAITKDWPALLRLLDRRGIQFRH